MLRFLRLSVIVFCLVLFVGAWYIAPALLDAEALRWLSGVVTVLWGLELLFYKKLEDVGAVQGLTSKEHERLVAKLARIRNRVWWVGGIGLSCSVAIWLLTTLKLPMTSPLYAAAVGALLGISISYLLLVPAWMNESQAFIDDTRRQDAVRKKRDEVGAKNK